jgi:hypothetical protein
MYDQTKIIKRPINIRRSAGTQLENVTKASLFCLQVLVLALVLGVNITISWAQQRRMLVAAP